MAMDLKKTWNNLVSRLSFEESRAAQADLLGHEQVWGLGKGWSPTTYGEYYAKSVPVYAAVTVRAESMARLPWKIFFTPQDGERREVGPGNRAWDLLQRPNPWFSPAELRYATECHLMLWGRAFWVLEDSLESPGKKEIWPVRPDRMQVLPGRGSRGPYIRGYVYEGLNGDPVAYLPEEVAYFRMFNPLEERAGLSPIAPLRLSVDMGLEGLAYNRNTFKSGGIPDYVLLAEGTMTQPEADAFYERWQSRYSGPAGMRRPAIATQIKDVKALAFSNRDLEFLETLKWTVEDASRVYRVPITMLGDLRFATLANVNNLEIGYWRNAMMPHAVLQEGQINHHLLPLLGLGRYEVAHDFGVIEVLGESEQVRLEREVEYLDRGVMTINEVRRGRGMVEVAWGNEPTPQEPRPGTERPGQRRGGDGENSSPGDPGSPASVAEKVNLEALQQAISRNGHS